VVLDGRADVNAFLQLEQKVLSCSWIGRRDPFNAQAICHQPLGGTGDRNRLGWAPPGRISQKNLFKQMIEWPGHQFQFSEGTVKERSLSGLNRSFRDAEVGKRETTGRGIQERRGVASSGHTVYAYLGESWSPNRPYNARGTGGEGGETNLIKAPTTIMGNA